MKHDTRRGRGRWKGCYSLKENDQSTAGANRNTKRNGGLKMGNTYYYYVGFTIMYHSPIFDTFAEYQFSMKSTVGWKRTTQLSLPQVAAHICQAKW